MYIICRIFILVEFSNNLLILLNGSFFILFFSFLFLLFLILRVLSFDVTISVKEIFRLLFMVSLEIRCMWGRSTVPTGTIMEKKKKL